MPSIQTTKHWPWPLIPAAVFCDVYVHVHVLQVCVQGTMEREDQQLCGFSDPEPGSQSVSRGSKVHQVLLQTLCHFCKFSDWEGFFFCSFFKIIIFKKRGYLALQFGNWLIFFRKFMQIYSYLKLSSVLGVSNCTILLIENYI